MTIAKAQIPEAALDKHVALLGMTGSGKTSVIKAAIVEPDLEADRRVLIITPKDDWWGLRLSKTGRTKGFDVPIFGGFHGDYPLLVKDAALLAEAYGTMKGSAIFCTARLSVQDRARWFAAFAETLLSKNRGWVRVVIDEAHVYMPKQGGKGGGAVPAALHAGNELVSQGRSLGLRIVLASQRSAKLHNDSLTQCPCLIAMMLMAPHDRDAVKDWIADQADPEQGKEIIASLANLNPGEAWVWAPRAKMLERVQFPRPTTFDSSAAPDEDAADGPKLAPINLDALRGKLASVEAEAKASDPKALRAEIARLAAELKKAASNVPQNIPADPDALKKAEERGFEMARKALAREAEKHAADAVVAAMDAMDALIGPIGVRLKEQIAATKKQRARLHVEFAPEPRQGPPAAGPGPEAPAPRAASVRRPAASPVAEAGGDRPLGAERRPLAVLAGVHPAGMTDGQWRAAAVFKKSGTWSTYLSRLRAAGRIEERDGLYFATEQGIIDLGGEVSAMPPPGPELAEFWISKINGVGPMLRHLVSIYPDWATREELGESINMVPTSGTFSTYIGRLNTTGLIEKDRGTKRVRASAAMMEGA